MHIVGSIDLNKYIAVTDKKIMTDKVIITDNCIDHIIRRRGQEFYDRYREKFAQIIYDPDYIFKDKNEDTAIACKRFVEDGKSINIILRLTVEGDNPDFKNSILTAIGEGDKRFAQRLRNNKPVYVKGIDKQE